MHGGDLHVNLPFIQYPSGETFLLSSVGPYIDVFVCTLQFNPTENFIYLLLII